jgi:hypothetical protein
MMLKLRPLVVVTGTIHVEGGATSKRRAPAPARSNGAGKRKSTTKTAVVTEELQVTDDRGRANSIIVTFSRALRKLTILRVPHGLLIDPANLPALQELSRRLTMKTIEFNRSAKTAEITNCWIIEPLQGTRRAAVEGWVARRLAKGDKKALAAKAALQVPSATPAEPPPPPPPAAEPEAPPEPVEPPTEPEPTPAT